MRAGGVVIEGIAGEREDGKVVILVIVTLVVDVVELGVEEEIGVEEVGIVVTVEVVDEVVELVLLVEEENVVENDDVVTEDVRLELVFVLGIFEVIQLGRINTTIIDKINTEIILTKIRL